VLRMTRFSGIKKRTGVGRFVRTELMLFWHFLGGLTGPL
jgi:hypothetical protein